MKVLAVKQPWASLIAEGKKIIEVRSIPTNIRGMVAIYATRFVIDDSRDDFRDAFSESHKMPYGEIIATAELVNCVKYDRADFDSTYFMHLADPTYYKEDRTYGWYLVNVEKLETPIPYKMPKGCVVWANTDIEVE